MGVVVVVSYRYSLGVIILQVVQTVVTSSGVDILDDILCYGPIVKCDCLMN